MIGRLAMALAIVIGWMTPALAENACLFHPGSYVKLTSPFDYEEVLLWNSRAKLEAFIRDEYDGYEAERFTVSINPPGAHAVVESACPRGNRHIVGVRIRSGPFAGRFGWVDVHDARP